MPKAETRSSDVGDAQLVDRVVYINRVAKVTKGGKRFKFTAVVVVGDQNGLVGTALGKAREVPDAIRKAVERAKRDMVSVPIISGTIPHPVIGKFGATKVIMRPAAEGTGVIAGGPVRAVLESCGVKNILAKCLGSRNAYNMVLATMDGLQKLMNPDEYHKRLKIARGQELDVSSDNSDKLTKKKPWIKEDAADEDVSSDNSDKLTKGSAG